LRFVLHSSLGFGAVRSRPPTLRRLYFFPDFLYFFPGFVYFFPDLLYFFFVVGGG
jgi:hypothetical protein